MPVTKQTDRVYGLQAYLLMKTDQPGVAVPLSEGLLKHAQSVWIESCKHIRVSGLHRDVARVLTLMGLPHTIEQLTDDSLFSVDLALIGAALNEQSNLCMCVVCLYACAYTAVTRKQTVRVYVVLLCKCTQCMLCLYLLLCA